MEKPIFLLFYKFVENNNFSLDFTINTKIEHIEVKL